MKLTVAFLAGLLALGAEAAPVPAELNGGDLVQRAIAINNASRMLNRSMVVNGRPTLPGQWEGTIMVIGSNGDCEDSGLCTGMFIHPEVVMTAGHCCAAGATKAICGGKERPGRKLAESVAMVTNNAGANDFCLLHLDVAVRDVPIYEVATAVVPQDAVIVGYGVSNSGSPQQGAGTQREGLVRIDRAAGVDIFVSSRGQDPWQNACNGDSGGPIFYQKPDASSGLMVVGGVTSRGSLFCPAGGVSIYTSAVEAGNAALITSTTRGWLGAAEEVVPGRCPVTNCCYDMVCPTRK